MIKLIIFDWDDVFTSGSILVGDAPNDMQMAWNAGIEPVAVLTGHLSRKEAADMGVKHIIDNVTLLESELEHM
jgi:phosphoglycolate phosphatase-like HAD superfamily hydrolase